jgi:hypothetical protein
LLKAIHAIAPAPTRATSAQPAEERSFFIAKEGVATQSDGQRLVMFLPCRERLDPLP